MGSLDDLFKAATLSGRIRAHQKHHAMAESR
jgi:hypothetical protein